MRRTTRVFGLVKSVDGPRVLRSGRRLWPESGDGKLWKENDGEEGYKKLVKSTTNSGEAVDGLVFKNTIPGFSRGIVKAKEVSSVVDIVVQVTSPNKEKDVCLRDLTRPGSMYKNVYTRTRKRLGSGGDAGTNKRFRFHKFDCRRRAEVGESDDAGDDLRWRHVKPVLSVVVKSSCGRNTWFPRFLLSVLRYAKSFRLRFTEISAFVLSEPIKSVYASTGIHFVKDQDHLVTTSVGVCEFFVSRDFTPAFCVDFSAIPRCFRYMHSRMLLRSMLQSFVHVNNFVNVNIDFGLGSDCPDMYSGQFWSFPSVKEPFKFGMLVHNGSDVSNSISLHPCSKGLKFAGRNIQYQNVLNARGIRRRRSSLRRRKASPSLVGIHKEDGLMSSDSRNGNVPSSPSGMILRSSVLDPSPDNLNEVSSFVVDSAGRIGSVGSAGRIGSSFCSANILVVEKDKGYRILRGIVTVDISASEECILALKKDGITKYSFKAEKVMRPPSSNRYTHVVTWSMDNGWMLEFPNKQDWHVFKKLYNVCSEQNVPSANVKSIPIPGVLETIGYGENTSCSYCRPDTYIRMNNDELSRAMSTGTPIYDMDSEDEQWLNKFNNELQQHVSEENFELMIVAFEKALFCSPYDFSYEKAPDNLCIGLGTREVLEGVFYHWIKRRKQKQLSLLRVFEEFKPKKATVVPKQPIFRKRRSFKRQPSQTGRGTQPNIFQVITSEQEAMEGRNKILKMEEAKAAASKCMKLAIRKRQRAQRLVENADLATYKALLLLRIAEAARVAESTAASAASVLD